MPGRSLNPATTAGTVYILRLLDVGSSIDLDLALARLKSWPVMRGSATLRGPLGAGAGGVVLSQSPVDVGCGEVRVGDATVLARFRLFEFGIASVRFALPVGDLDGEELVKLAASVEDDAGFDDAARELWKKLAMDLGPAIKNPPTSNSFIEDYSVFVLPAPPSPAERSDELLARLLMGEDEARPLAPTCIAEALARGIRYFADDLVLVDYDAAVVVDPTCSTELVDIFELASAHLLGLRYYDQLLGRSTAALVQEVSRRQGLFRSSFGKLSERAMLLVLEVGELADSFAHSITLMGDTYSVQVYRLTAEQLRIPEATAAVHQKLEVLSRSAEALHGHVETRRGVALEVLVVFLITLEIVLAFVRH